MAVVAVNVADVPAHIGLLPVVCAMDMAGATVGFTTTVVVATGLVQPLTVAVTL